MADGWWTFLYGCLGSAVVELLRCLRHIQRGRIPAYYRTKLFWIIQGLVTLAAGGVATGCLQNRNDYLAIYIGVSLPVIIKNFSQKPPELLQ